MNFRRFISHTLSSKLFDLVWWKHATAVSIKQAISSWYYYKIFIESKYLAAREKITNHSIMLPFFHLLCFPSPLTADLWQSLCEPRLIDKRFRSNCVVYCLLSDSFRTNTYILRCSYFMSRGICKQKLGFGYSQNRLKFASPNDIESMQQNFSESI